MNLPFALGPQARAERDGCGCPSQVRRCVHWGEWVLVVSSLTPEAELHYQCNPTPMSRYSVGKFLAGKVYQCRCGAWRIAAKDSVIYFQTDDEDKALAAFHTAELELLRGESKS